MELMFLFIDFFFGTFVTLQKLGVNLSGKVICVEIMSLKQIRAIFIIKFFVIISHQYLQLTVVLYTIINENR